MKKEMILSAPLFAWAHSRRLGTFRILRTEIDIIITGKLKKETYRWFALIYIAHLVWKKLYVNFMIPKLLALHSGF